jgi:hypothetical protein
MGKNALAGKKVRLAGKNVRWGGKSAGKKVRLAGKKVRYACKRPPTGALRRVIGLFRTYLTISTFLGAATYIFSFTEEKKKKTKYRPVEAGHISTAPLLDHGTPDPAPTKNKEDTDDPC